MESVRLIRDINYGDYSCIDDSNVNMLILGTFFTDDVVCDKIFKEWAETAKDGDSCSGNITRLEMENDDILMTDIFPEVSAVLKMTRNQFINLYDEWLKKVCKKEKPKEVIIFYDNDKFWIETKE